jgi:hypothetical protein
MKMQLQYLTEIVVAAFGLLACFFPQVDGLVADHLLLIRWRAGLIGRAMQSARAEKCVSLLFSLFSGKKSLFRISPQGCTPLLPQGFTRPLFEPPPSIVMAAVVDERARRSRATR